MLSAVGLLHHRWVLGCLTLSVGTCCWALVLTHGWNSSAPSLGYTASLPLAGPLNIFHLLFLSYLFLIGVCARTWSHLVPISGCAVALAAVTLVATWMLGGFLTVGLLAYAYLILWLTVALPSLLHGIGRDRDYSFGVYIYGFAMQQVVALVGGARWGLPGYLAVCLVSTLIVAAASWHLVEKPALQWKNWNPAAKLSMPSSGPVPEPEAEARAGARTAQEMEPRPVR